MNEDYLNILMQMQLTLASIVSDGKIADETAEMLEKAIVDYKAGFVV